MAITPFRRSIKADTKSTGRGKGRKGLFYEKLTIPKDIPTPILVIDAQYPDPNPSAEEVEIDQTTGRPKPVMKPYYKARIHKRVVNANTPSARYYNTNCSAGWNAHNPQPCAGCAAMDRGDNTVTAPDVAAFTVIHLATYHKHPMIDRKTGGIVMKRDPQNPGPVMIDDECTGRTCNYCRTINNQPLIPDPKWPGFRAQDIETFFGKRRYLELGRGHLGNIGTIEGNLAGTCGHDGQLLVTESFTCPHCNAVVIDMSSDPREDAEIAEVTSHPYPCLQCQRPVLLNEVQYCPTCDAANPPREMLQLSWTERVLFLCREGENKSSQVVCKQHQSLQQFEQMTLPNGSNGKRLGDIISELAKPYDFSQVYAAKPVQEQMEDLGLATPGQVQSGPQNIQAGSGYGQGGYAQPQSQPQQPGPQPMQPMQRPHFGNN
jgi:hypothetical protein